MRPERTLVRQRCFQIPRHKLDLFMVALYVNFTNELCYYEVEYVFENKDEKFYDVIVNTFGHYYPFVQDQMEKFIVDMAKT